MTVSTPLTEIIDVYTRWRAVRAPKVATSAQGLLPEVRALKRIFADLNAHTINDLKIHTVKWSRLIEACVAKKSKRLTNVNVYTWLHFRDFVQETYGVLLTTIAIEGLSTNKVMQSYNCWSQILWPEFYLHGRLLPNPFLLDASHFSLPADVPLYSVEKEHWQSIRGRIKRQLYAEGTKSWDQLMAFYEAYTYAPNGRRQPLWERTVVQKQKESD